MIPWLDEKPLRTLGRQYTADLADKEMGKQARQQLVEGLVNIEQSQLPGKYKVWCYWHILYQRVVWPLKISEISITSVSKMDSLAKTYPEMAGADLFGQNMLRLLLKSISLGYKQEKARLGLELRDSGDPMVRSSEVMVTSEQAANGNRRLR